MTVDKAGARAAAGAESGAGALHLENTAEGVDRALQVVGVDELAPARGELLRRLGGRGILLKHERRHPSAWASALLTTLASKRQLAPRARRGLCRQLTRCGSRFEHSELRCKTSVLAQQAWSRLQRSSQAAPGGSMERRGNRTEARGSLALQLLRAAAHGRVRSLEHRRRERRQPAASSLGVTIGVRCAQPDRFRGWIILGARTCEEIYFVYKVQGRGDEGAG
jgi:hypothetical protein